VFKITITNNPDEQIGFSDRNGHGKHFNYKPLMGIRDILRLNELSYLGYECIEACGKKLTNNIHFHRYKGIEGKRIVVTDEINNKKIEFMGRSPYEEQHKKEKKEFGIIAGQILTFLGLYDRYQLYPEFLNFTEGKRTTRQKAIEEAKQLLSGKKEIRRPTPKQIEWAAKLLNVSQEEANTLNFYQAYQLMDACFNQSWEIKNKVKQFYLDTIKKRSA
jgi:hypothetical protein